MAKYEVNYRATTIESYEVEANSLEWARTYADEKKANKEAPTRVSSKPATFDGATLVVKGLKDG